jgi:nucleosome binding factor SPN SPT16 subunit
LLLRFQQNTTKQALGDPTKNIITDSVDIYPLIESFDPYAIHCFMKAGSELSKISAWALQEKIESIVDAGTNVAHQAIALKVMEHIKRTYLNQDTFTCQLPPVIQSTSSNNIQVSIHANSDGQHLITEQGIITVQLSLAYKYMNALIARTYLINPTRQQKLHYSALQAAYNAGKSS